MKIFILIVLFSVLSFSILFAGQREYQLNDTAEVVKTALDYADGFYSGDAVRMERALHPDFNKVSPMKVSETGNTILYYSTFSGLIEMSRAKSGLLDEDKRKIKVIVLKIDGDIAFVKINTAMFNDYLEMVKISEHWKIINVLWTDGADSPRKKSSSDFNPEIEKDAIILAVTDLYEGIFTGDASRLDRSLHTEYNGASISKMTKNSVIITKDGFSLLREVAQSKMRLLEKDKWNLKIDILDIMDGLAAVEVNLPSSLNYYQLAKMDGKWKIINGLKKF